MDDSQIGIEWLDFYGIHLDSAYISEYMLIYGTKLTHNGKDQR